MPIEIVSNIPAGTYARSSGGSVVIPTLTVVADQATPAVGSTVTFTTNAATGSTFTTRRNGTTVTSGVVGTDPVQIVTTGFTAGDTITCRVLSGAQDVTSAGVNLVSSAPTRTYYRRATATSTTTVTATWTGINIADVTESKLVIAIFGRTGNTGTVNININGGGAQSMTSSSGASTRCAFIIVDKPGGSTMDVTSVSSNGNWAGTGEANIAIWGISAGSIVSSGFDMKNLLTTDQTYSATLNVPAGGAVFVVRWPRSADTSITITTALSGADVDAEWRDSGPFSRTLASRAGLSANASYVVSTVMRKDPATQSEMAFGAIAVGP